MASKSCLLVCMIFLVSCGKEQSLKTGGGLGGIQTVNFAPVDDHDHESTSHEITDQSTDQGAPSPTHHSIVESGEDESGTKVEVVTLPKIKPDPGSAEVVDLMQEAIGTGEHETVISVRSFHNQSRTTPEEFDILRQRICHMLDGADENHLLRFVLDEPPDTEYTLGGTVYMITRDNVDQWEIYFALKPYEANWVIWRNDQPIRVLRQPEGKRDSLRFVGRRRTDVPDSSTLR